MKTGELYDHIYQQWLAIDEWEQMEHEILSTLRLAVASSHGVSSAKRAGRAAHPADKEFKASAMDKSIELAKAYTEKAMREDPSKLYALSDVINKTKAKKSRESVPKLIVGKLLLDFLKASDRLPQSREELIESASNECRADIAEQKLAPSQLLTRGLEYYGLADSIKDKPGRKT